MRGHLEALETHHLVDLDVPAKDERLIRKVVSFQIVIYSLKISALIDFNLLAYLNQFFSWKTFNKHLSKSNRLVLFLMPNYSKPVWIWWLTPIILYLPTVVKLDHLVSILLTGIYI